MKRIIVIILSALAVLLAIAQDDQRFLAPQQKYSGKYGYVNQKGLFIIQAKFDDARQFREGFGAVEMGGKWGFVNHRGRLIVPCKYTTVMDFNGGYAIVRQGDKWGAVNTQGVLEIPCDYDRPEDLLDLKVIKLTPEQIEMLKKMKL